MEKHLKIAGIVAQLLDTKFRFLKIRFGFTSIFDIIPGLGDVIDAVLSLYLVWIGIQMKLPRNKIYQMLANIGINFIIGLIPIFGGLIYLIRKANIKNLEILKTHYAHISGRAQLTHS